MRLASGIGGPVTLLLAGARRRFDDGCMLTHAAMALYLVVRVYDAQSLPATELTAARAVAEHILKDVNIAVRWTDCPCSRPVGPGELVIRISASTPGAVRTSLGFSYVDVQQKTGTLATLYADRVHELAETVHVEKGELLGRAMAHEIGHLLLGTSDHAAAGLMRGTWTSMELANNRPLDWRLSRQDGADMRQALVRRIREPRSLQLARIEQVDRGVHPLMIDSP